LAYFLHPYAAKAIAGFFSSWNAWLLPAGFIITLLVIRIALGLILRFVTRAISFEAQEGALNKALGLIPGAVNGWLFSILFSAMLYAIPVENPVSKEAHQSRLADPLADQSKWVNKKLAPVFDAAVRETMENMGGNNHPGNIALLHFTHDHPTVRPLLERSMIDMINRERLKYGLNPVKYDPELTKVARAHSKDMFLRGFFAHDNPDGKDPFDRMRDANVKFKTAGENLALAQTLEIAHKNLMNSPGHRANILHPDFGRVGIGVMDGGFYGIMVSQEFRD
ncbi:MAG: hypothetical protein EOP06_26855, partial [Proteobacteria bacterium]